MMTPDHPAWAVPPEEAPHCESCGGPTKYPCICDYFADPDDTLEYPECA